mmetsp:Transcript_55759/g.143687  ORF Transcript_55759/g.143687 Transcript_55759/m.143687 type:complete len:358 (-) Transcript_55759:164-1237(-)
MGVHGGVVIVEQQSILDAGQQVDAGAGELHGAGDHLLRVAHVVHHALEELREERLDVAVQGRHPRRNLHVHARVARHGLQLVDHDLGLLDDAAGHAHALGVFRRVALAEPPRLRQDRRAHVELPLPVVAVRAHHAQLLGVQRDAEAAPRPRGLPQVPQGGANHLVAKLTHLSQLRLQIADNVVLHAPTVGGGGAEEVLQGAGQLPADALHAPVAHAAHDAEHGLLLLLGQVERVQATGCFGRAPLQQGADVPKAVGGDSMHHWPVFGAQGPAASGHQLLCGHLRELAALEQHPRGDVRGQAGLGGPRGGEHLDACVEGEHAEGGAHRDGPRGGGRALHARRPGRLRRDLASGTVVAV